MIKIPGYIVEDEILRESTNFFVYRGKHTVKKYPVVIKILKDSLDLAEKSERLRYEYQLMNDLKGEGTVKVYALEKFQNRLAMILEDFKASSLVDILQHRKKLDTKTFLYMAIRITEALEKIHQHGIIHKNINTKNILWDEKSSQAKIVDFQIASILAHEMAEIYDAQYIQPEMLQYFSPEQTGRMNRGIDYRTDFYSLGVVFYQLITGELPFKSNDINELVHHHVAKTPLSPHAIDNTIPIVIANIIMKLLAKTAEDRYQSLFGLKEDLKNCEAQYRSTKHIEPFIIASKDLQVQFQISERFYGRERELNKLLEAFNQASVGRARLMLVAGAAGIGKSSLVHELYKPLVEKRGYFIAGKFDQFKRNIPYMSLAQAFEGFIQQLSTQSEEKINEWRIRLLQALGTNGKIVIDVIPALTAVIGEQPPVPILGPAETQNRFNLVFQSFIRCLASHDHPLAIFLDDLQWADFPTLKLLENLLLYAESKNFLIIGAYRDNEVDKNHILATSLEVLSKANFPYEMITLKPLSLKHVKQLLVDTFRNDRRSISDLANVCFQKTQGNPFFLNQFLQTLHQENLVEFNYEQGTWEWDISKIEQKSTTSNVVDLMVEKLQKLPLATQKVIELASCLGNKFDLMRLSLIYDKAPKDTSNDLWEALDKGLIVPTVSTYKYVSNVVNVDVNYQFSHDRVQQAAYSMIDDQQRDSVRFKIGKVLLQHTDEKDIEENVIEIVNQINFGLDLVKDEQEQVLYAELNLKAGIRAKDSIAYKVALNYLKTGIKFLGKNRWIKHYDLALALHTEIVEAAYLATDFEIMEQSTQTVIKNARSLLDKIRVYEIEILYLTNHHEYEKAINIMQYVLHNMGINLPSSPSKLDIIFYLIRTKLALFNKNIEQLENQEEMKDPNKIAVLRIIRCAAGASYLYSPNLFVLAGFKATGLLVRYGNTPLAARSFIVYGHILCGALNQLEAGYKFGQLSMKLCDKYAAEEIRAQVWMVHGVFIKHWHDHLSSCAELIFNAYQKGLETGDIEYAGYSIAGYSLMQMLLGKELTKLDKSFEKYQNVLLSIEQKTGFSWLEPITVAVKNLLGLNNETSRLKSENFDENVAYNEFLAKKDNIGGLAICILKIWLSYYFGDYKQAYEWSKKGLNFIGAIGAFLLPNYYFLFSLACLACCYNANEKEFSQYMKQVKKNQKKMYSWQKHAAMNYENKYYLIEAEIARVMKNSDKAESYYDRAIELARQNQFLQEEALANEIAGKYYLASGSEHIAKAYLNDAYSCYKLWGATTKAQNMLKQYGYIISAGQQRTGLTPRVNALPANLTKSLDIGAIMKGAQAIAQEVELESLLKKMLHIVIETAGAQVGYLLLEKNNKWYIEGEGRIEKEQVTVLQSIPIEGVLPITIINSVIRKLKPLIIDNAARDSQFAFDPYIRKNESKSIFAMPLLNQDKLYGILYLENNLIDHAFTQGNTDILINLSAQIVTAIDNAKQYDYRKKLTAASERFFPDEYLRYLNKSNITDIKLGDQVQKKMTILYSDIRNFTTLSEVIGPQESFYFLNNYLKEIEIITIQNHGFIDKYIGDAFIALFRSANDALNASLSILQTLDELNEQSPLKTKIGIGLATGLVTLGIVGVERRMQSTAISTAVDIANDLQELTKKYQVPLLITESTYYSLKNPGAYAIRRLDTKKFLEEAENIYEVFDNETEQQINLKVRTQEDFEEAIRLYNQHEFKKSLQLFNAVVNIDNTDLPARFFIERCIKKL